VAPSEARSRARRRRAQAYPETVELIEIHDEERDALREVAAELNYRVSLTDETDLRLAFLARLLRGIALRAPVPEPSLSR
jgi:hypothetical protein